MNISIIIPTWNREDLVEDLLASLEKARAAYRYGDSEVIVVDSSEGAAREAIMKSCTDHDARYYYGDNSVRKKRNLGIDRASYEVIHFIDSDVTVCEDILNIHAETFLNDDDPMLGGSFGLTEFVGPKNFWWKIVEHTTYLDSFRFAKMFPYQSWTIGNNVAFKKDVLLEIGKFQEDFHFKLGGDDLEMTYRITKAGYRIKSAPDAVAYHSTETWSHASAIHNRTKRWGHMEYYIRQAHPELFVNCIPKSDVLFGVFLILCAVLSLIRLTPAPLFLWCGWLVLYVIVGYLIECGKQVRNPFYYLAGKWIHKRYHWYFIKESISHKDFSCLHKEMSFSVYQSLHMYKEETAKLWVFLCTFFVSLPVWAIIMGGL